MVFSFDLKFDFDHALTLNLIIAAATTTAAAIHFDSVGKQRKDRVWKINKENLIKLSKSLADAIEVSSKLSAQEFNRINNIPDNTCTEGSAEVNLKFQQTISNSLNVYKPLLNSELVAAIEKYQQTEKILSTHSSMITLMSLRLTIISGEHKKNFKKL